MSCRASLLPLGLLALIVSLVGPPHGHALAKKGKKYALLVGVQEYDHAKQFKPLLYAENDVNETAKELKKAGYAVTLLTTSDDTNKPTLANINKHLDAILAKATKHDLILVGLAGHGLQFAKQEGSYFCPVDARIQDVKTLLSMQSVYKKLEDSPVGVGLLLVDACRDDGGPRAARRRGVDGDKVPSPPRGVAALFSCSSEQFAWETPKFKHGVFFHFVLEGLRGKAKDEDNEVTWASLSAYVSKQVSKTVPELIGGGATQEPHEMKNITGKSPVLMRHTVASEAESLYRLGVAYHRGQGKTINLKEAVRCYHQASEKGHPWATASLGILYANGDGVAKDKEKAEELCRKALDQVKEGAREGEPIAQYLLGFLYDEGIALEKNPKEGAKWYRKAAVQRYAAAQYSLAWNYEHGEGGLEKDANEAVKWYRKAAAQGYAGAQNNLGTCYQNGTGVEKDEKEAVSWYRQAAVQGYATAQYNLAWCYANGKGVEKDEKEAVSWYRKAALQGDADAQLNLGWSYDNGKGVEKDETEATKWYRKAALQGHAKAQFNLAWNYDHGEGGVEKDEKEAVKWYRKAAAQGHASAQDNLGWCYKKGDGVEQDYKEALRWFHKAAAQGEANAQNNIGLMYEYGLGVGQDYAEAYRWYRKAAAKNHAWAQHNLGVLYQYGRSVGRDLDEARRWLRKAATQGHEPARKRLANLE